MKLKHTPMTNAAHKWVAIALTSALGAGCSVIQDQKVDYKSAKPAASLEVPPDLTQLTRDSRYNVPGGSVTASGFELRTPAQQQAATAIAKSGDAQIERAGTQRWLVINRPVEQVLPTVREFWQERGFSLTLDDAKLGLLETDWAENRAKIPQDIIRSTIGKIFDGLYSTGERDKFRTRIERNDKGGTEIYISHRGMIEVYTSDKREQTAWQPRPSDPELENEFLRRLMVKLGASEEDSKAIVAGGAPAQAAQITKIDGQSILQLNDGYDRAWRRVGLALDRTGFTVEDRNRSEGVYFVRYAINDENASSNSGFFGRLFGNDKKEPTPSRYRIQLKSTGSQTIVNVLTADGQADRTANADKILQLLAQDLK